MSSRLPSVTLCPYYALCCERSGEVYQALSPHAVTNMVKHIQALSPYLLIMSHAVKAIVKHIQALPPCVLITLYAVKAMVKLIKALSP